MPVGTRNGEPHFLNNVVNQVRRPRAGNDHTLDPVPAVLQNGGPLDRHPRVDIVGLVVGRVHPSSPG